MNIPTKTLLSTDARLTYLDAAISSRASEFGLDQVKGANFDTAMDSLRNIRVLLPTMPSPSQEDIDEIKKIEGTGFDTTSDTLEKIRENDTKENAAIKSDTEALLSNGKPI